MTITPDQIPAQHQDRTPALESEMVPRPQYDDPNYKGSGKLQDKVALITGGDSGIGRSVAVYYAKGHSRQWRSPRPHLDAVYSRCV